MTAGAPRRRAFPKVTAWGTVATIRFPAPGALNFAGHQAGDEGATE